MNIARGATSQPKRARRPRRSIFSDESAITSLEFALVGPLMFLLAIMVIAFGGFVFGRSVLDNATIDAVRTFQTGQVVTTPGSFATK